MFEYTLLDRARAADRTSCCRRNRRARAAATDVLLRRRVVELTLLGPEAEVHGAAAGSGSTSTARTCSTRGSGADRALRGRVRRAARTQGRDRRRRARHRLRRLLLGTMMVALGWSTGWSPARRTRPPTTIRPAFELVKTRTGRLDRLERAPDVPRRPRAGLRRLRRQPAPDAEQLADIAISSATTAAQFRIEPRMAMLCCSTGRVGHRRRGRARAQGNRARAARAQQLSIEGPIQSDAAVDATWRRRSCRQRDRGRATDFIFPDLNTGNNTARPSSAAQTRSPSGQCCRAWTSRSTTSRAARRCATSSTPSR